MARFAAPSFAMFTDADDDKVYMPIAKSPNMLEPAK